MPWAVYADLLCWGQDFGALDHLQTLAIFRRYHTCYAYFLVLPSRLYVGLTARTVYCEVDDGGVRRPLDLLGFPA